MTTDPTRPSSPSHRSHDRGAQAGAQASRDWSADRGAKWRRNVDGLEAMLAPVDPTLFEALDIRGPVRVADVGCGGGGTSVALARSLPAGSQAHGFDISPDLVAYARTRPDALDRPLDFSVSDVGTDAAPDRPFDRLVSRFGMMFFPEPVSAFGNLHRWLTPDGRFAFAVWGPREQNPWMTELREAIAAAVDLPEKEPGAPGPFRYADPDVFLDVLTSAGFRDVRSEPWRGTLPLGGGLPAADAADFATRAFSVGAHLDEIPPDQAAEVRRDLVRRLADHEVAGRVQMSAAAHIVTGRG